MRACVHTNVDDARELPDLIDLGHGLTGAAFFLMKLLPAKLILDSALQDGDLKPGGLVAETTSGTFGLALAIVCRLRGLRFVMVSDPVIEPGLRRRIEDLGASVDIVAEPAKVGGFQRARLDRLAEIRRQNPGSFWPCQYDNPRNAGAYAKLAAYLTMAIGPIDCLVGTVGSGGSMSGTTRYLRSMFPELVALGVDTFRSVLFGQPDGKRVLRGLGNSLQPGNLDHSVFDEVHWIDAPSAFRACRTLHREHGLYMGPTSGAAYHVARWYTRQNPGARTVVLLPDEGYRYQDTIYNDAWLKQEGLFVEAPPCEPIPIDRPEQAFGSWSRFDWGRRPYAKVLGARPQGAGAEVRG